MAVTKTKHLGWKWRKLLPAFLSLKVSPFTNEEQSRRAGYGRGQKRFVLPRDRSALDKTGETFERVHVRMPRRNHHSIPRHYPSMKHEAAIAILEKVQTKELRLRHDVILCAVRYASLRADWRLAPLNERRVMDAGRTAAHNALIGAINSLSGAMVKAGENTTWRKDLGDDRQEIGDWACHVHSHLGIEAR